MPIKKASHQEIDQMVERAKKGSKPAKEMLLLTFKPLVLSIIEQSQIPPWDRDDAFQDGMAFFLEGVPKFDALRGAGFNAFIKSYLFRCFLKRKSGQFSFSVRASEALDEPMPGEGALMLADVLGDERICIERDYEIKDRNKRLLESVLTRLPKRQSQAIYAYYYEGKTLKAIGREMGISFKAVGNLRDKGLKNLKNWV